MRTLVIAYSALLIALSLITLAFFIDKARRDPNPSQSVAVFVARDIFHIFLGATLLVLVLSNLVMPVTAFVISAVLLIGFEYSIVIVRKIRS